MTLDAHPIALHFPLLEGEEYERFRADIEKRGLIEPIWLYEGKILDGRNRYRACCDLGVQAKTREYTGDSPMGFSWSLNGERRHLSHAQKTVVALDLLPELEAEAKKREIAGKGPDGSGGRGNEKNPTARMPEGFGEAAEQAAEIVGVSAKSVYQAKVVKRADPETFAKIKTGELAVAKAYRQVKGAPVSSPVKKQPRAQRSEDIQRLSNEGNRPEQVAEELGISVEQVRKIAKEEGLKLADAANKSHRINVERVIEQTVTAIEGCALGIQVINGQLQAISPQQARQWADSLTEPLKALSTLRRKLLEIAE